MCMYFHFKTYVYEYLLKNICVYIFEVNAKTVTANPDSMRSSRGVEISVDVLTLVQKRLNSCTCCNWFGLVCV